MTEDEIKEALSNNYVACIANKLGYKLVQIPKEKGVDFKVMYSIKRTLPNGRIRMNESPYSCDLQLKATTIKSISIIKNKVKYNLEAKNYNDLVYRKNLGYTPLILILFILPNDEDEWVKILQDEIRISKNAYWYYPSDDENEEVINKASKTIYIPLNNKLDFSFFECQIKTWVPQWK